MAIPQRNFLNSSTCYRRAVAEQFKLPTLPPGALLHYEYRAPARLRAKWPVPKERNRSGNSCPYCDQAMSPATRDHVFPQSLGGRRCIQSCKPCNDRFGHTIEAAAEAEMFTRNYVLLSAFGLRHIREGAVWKDVYSREGNSYHLIARAGTVEERLADPVITRDELGRITGGTFPDAKMAQPLIRHAQRQGRKVEIVPDGEMTKIIPSLASSFDFGPVVLRPALKICLAAAALLPVERHRLADARSDLAAEPSVDLPRCTVVSIDYLDIKDFGKPLSHVVYVESAPHGVYGVVQFFGVMQIWCGLSDVPAPGADAAVCGTLDPVTGKERFDFTTALNLPINFGERVPTQAYNVDSLAQWIVSGLQQQALQRGGKNLGLRIGPG